MLIVKETDSRLIERLIEVESLLSDRTLPLDIMVYTPEEMRFLYSVGSPFYRKLIEKLSNVQTAE